MSDRPALVPALRGFALLVTAQNVLVNLVAGSLVVIPYLELSIVPLLSPAQRAAHHEFVRVVIPTLYVLFAALGWFYARDVERGDRARALALPWGLGTYLVCAWGIAALSSVAWMRAAAPLDSRGLWLHYALAPVLCGTYCAALVVFATERLVRRRVLPALFPDGDLAPFARATLRVRGRQWLVYLAGGLVPLGMFAAVSMLHLSAAGTGSRRRCCLRPRRWRSSACS